MVLDSSERKNADTGTKPDFYTLDTFGMLEDCVCAQAGILFFIACKTHTTAKHLLPIEYSHWLKTRGNIDFDYGRERPLGRHLKEFDGIEPK